jgi:AcrR family transcriptional regulator
MEEMDCSKKEMILNVTLDLLKKEGFERITVRKIAKAANVNVALVNYYFGSKDKLLNAAVQVLITSFKETFHILDNAAMEPRERLKLFMIQYLNANQQYPFIVRRLVSEETFMFDSQIEFVEFLKAIGMKNLQHTIEELSGESDPQKLTVMTSHLLGAAFLPTLMEPLYIKVTGIPFPDTEMRIDILLDRYFHETEKTR